MKTKMTTFSLCCTALMTAIICIMTMVIQIPIPLGYAHLGDAFILISAAYLGKRESMWASGVGSSLADLLTGYTQWVIPTFFIKIIIAFIAAQLMFDKNRTFHLFSIRNGLAAVLSMTWMVIGYTAVGCILYGSVAAGIASTPGLIAEGIVNAAVYFLIAGVFEKANVRSLLHTS